ncbi:VWA domain-containing protein [Gilvimarinus sp. F26214L]|uniref:VWA domain-containing protein n=1 Tax=Gilvimarinus sp. DZF01 TaxID=3461371 RepID=UPI004045D65F
MMKHIALILLALSLLACSGEPVNYKRGVYLLLDTSGTYTQELEKAQKIINFLLAKLEAGDTLVVARIDSGSFSEKDIVAKVVLDSRPSAANQQKRQFADVIDQFATSVESSAYTDISGGLLQAIDYLNEADVGQKTIFIFSDMKEELPEGYMRDFDLTLDGFAVKALNVTKLRSDNVNPDEYLQRMADWQSRVEQGGGHWTVINDLDRPEALTF